jgi:hypothetical protein
LLVAIGAASLLLIAGCQSTPTGTTSAAPQPNNATQSTNPRPVVVHDFAFEVSQLQTEQGLLAGHEGPAKRIVGELHPQETPAQKAARLAELLSETIANELSTLQIPANRQPLGAPLPADGLLVGGQFLQVDEGNRLKRAIVGFGGGSTEVLVQVAVYDLARSRDEPILVYGTGSGSKPTPGAAVSLNPYAMAARYVLSRNATEKDVRKLGRQIAKDLAQVEAGNLPKH